MRLAALGILVALPLKAFAANVTGKVSVADKSGAKGTPPVVVWLEGGPAPKEPPKPVKGTFQMMSKEKRFTPPLLVVPVGSEVSFPNMDPIFHNVFSVSGENRFDLGLYKSGASKGFTFKKAGLVRVYCNIHSSMVGFIRVVDGPYWATSKADGSFEIRDVPAGKYTLKSWEEKAGESTRPITVTDKGAVVPLDLDAKGFEPKPHLNKYGQAYKAGSDDERY